MLLQMLAYFLQVQELAGAVFHYIFTNTVTLKRSGI